LAKVIGTKGLMRPAVVAAAIASSLNAAHATPDLTLRCNPAEGVDAAGARALCDAFTDALAKSGKAISGTPVAMQLNINNLRPTAINVTLNLTGADGGAHTINRALSVSDTTITPAMQDDFLQKLISAIPSD
jgi:methylthioribose-1-phosphate isomerase